MVAKLQAEFEARNCKIVAVSMETGACIQLRCHRWHPPELRTCRGSEPMCVCVMAGS